MDIFQYAQQLQYGDLHFCVDAEIGLHAIVAIHNLKFGPAIGGCRFLQYTTSDAAIRDALRLGRGMTYKAAISNLPHGGGKAVIIEPPNMTPEQREQIFTAFGAFVDSLGGRYITAEDSGTHVADMNIVRRKTQHVLCYDDCDGGSSGDPSPFTALGVHRGIEAAAKFTWGSDDLSGRHIAIQGVGNVGYLLAKRLHEAGARLTIADIRSEAAERCADEFGAAIVSPAEIFAIECDIFSPCALGAAINDHTLPALRCQIVAGSANNQLAENLHGSRLLERGILYAPDYAINAGGLINAAAEYSSYDPQKVNTQIVAIYDTMLEIFERSRSENMPTNVVTDRIVEEKLYGQPLA